MHTTAGTVVPPALTVASTEHCAPHERLHLQQLMLNTHGVTAKTSLDFYQLGPLLGEGSFAKV
jgi:hypothetical protein